MQPAERGGSDHQDRRLKAMQGDQNPPQQQHPPQKCPRCDSLNTKFCYYNNYSLSQPRYFCKACRRYWTQGGTLRNVPVGGGCRKGKRAKTSSSSDDNNSKPQLAPPQQPPQLVAQNIISTASSGSASKAKEPTGTALGSFYQGGGFLSTLAAVRGFKPPANPSHGGAGGGMSGSLNLGMFQGFGISSLIGSPQQQETQPMNFYQVGRRDQNSKGSESMYMVGGQEGLIQPSWTHQSFTNFADTTLWSTSTTTSSATNGGGGGGGGKDSSNTTSTGFVSGHQWPDHVPGYGPP